MVRRKRKSEFEQWIEVFAKLPWQVCLALAPVVWFGFDLLSQLSPPPATEIQNMGGVVFVAAASTAGMFLKYLVPAMLAIAALVSWLSKRRRAKLLADTTARTDSAPLLSLSWQQFESLVVAYFEREGYHATLTQSGADGGVDAIAKKDGETFLIQCKQWRATKVGVDVVRELFGVMSAQGATGGYVVSAGPFTRPAIEFAEGRNIELINANRIVRIVKRLPAQSVSGEPVCPKCGAGMVKRTAKRGANAGNQFWGCSRYPECRGTVSI